MKIPESVKIGGIIYNVEITSMPCKCNPLVDGEIRYSGQVIALKDANDIGKEYQEYVLVHELIHGLYNHMNIEQDEDMVDKLAKALHMVIKDNPDMFKEVKSK